MKVFRKFVLKRNLNNYILYYKLKLGYVNIQIYAPPVTL